MDRKCLVYEYITGYLKNLWAKHRLVCTHSDAFSMMIPNMDTKFNNSGHVLKILIFFVLNFFFLKKVLVHSITTWVDLMVYWLTLWPW